MSSPTPAMEFAESSVVKAVDHQTATEVDGENVILDLEEGVYYGLNPVGARIWELIQEPARIGEVGTAIAEEYDVSYEQCFDDVVSLLRDLEKENLITVKQR